MKQAYKMPISYLKHSEDSSKRPGYSLVEGVQCAQQAWLPSEPLECIHRSSHVNVYVPGLMEEAAKRISEGTFPPFYCYLFTANPSFHEL